jgi:hypothetical protein
LGFNYFFSDELVFRANFQIPQVPIKAAMRYLRPKTASTVHDCQSRQPYLFEATNAGMGARGGPNRDLFQPRYALLLVA